MSSAFMRESEGPPRIWASEESARSSAETWRVIDGKAWDFEVRARQNGGFMLARLSKDGAFDSWVTE